jgi:hypothetical protein
MAFTVDVFGLQVEVEPELTAYPQDVEVRPHPGLGQGMFTTRHGMFRADFPRITVGADPGDGVMASFALSARALGLRGPRPGPSRLKVGFIQNVLSTHRLATYVDPQFRSLSPVFTMSRNAALVGAGLLDCGNDDPPWFGGKSTFMVLATDSAVPPAKVAASDNPRWTIPVSLAVPNKPYNGALRTVELNDHFGLHVALYDGVNYISAAYIEWGTDVLFTVADYAGNQPRGFMNGRCVWKDPQWRQGVGIQSTDTTRRANRLLVDILN